MKYKQLLIFLADTAAIFLSFLLAFLLRFDLQLSPSLWQLFWLSLPVVLVVKPLVFLSFRFYRNLWRYASLRDALDIVRVVTTASLVAGVIFVPRHLFTFFPRSILVIDWFLLLFLVLAGRVAWRLYREMSAGNDTGGTRALLFGAGEAGSKLLSEIRRQTGSPYHVVGFVDDDATKHGMLLNGVPILGGRGQLPALVKEYNISEIIIAVPSARGNVLRSIMENCRGLNVRCRTLPSLGDIIDGKISVSQIRDVDINDLLGRAPVILDEAGISRYLAGKKVLISGAAGSIGSEICRQVARFAPRTLILLDNAETPLFYVERELTARFPEMNIVAVLGDVRNAGKVELIFAEFAPDAVFHAAAYKHVPVMEQSPTEAVMNNIVGTRIMADAAHRFGARDFVMISTDKAVRPTSVMGASKRVAEIYVQGLSRRSSTNFSTVRFGNVLGSNGSVIPLFREQISKGGPVTVTDRDVVRYFMTIPEAAQLVLQAGCLGKGGEIFVLDMGEPVRIVSLAEELIRLSGLIPYEDIDIVFTGLRPGEKLFEELLIDGEGIVPTTHDKIRIAASVGSDLRQVTAELDQLAQLAGQGDVAGIVHSLRRLVLDFTPSPQLIRSAASRTGKHLSDLLSKRAAAKILHLRVHNAEQSCTHTIP
ncbi:MAG TPA: nucleoside-diphosphate sugar epimerase/dehydratase [Geobacteraceae bacterium]